MIQDITDVSCFAQTNLRWGTNPVVYFHDQRAMTEAGAGSEVTERKCNAAGFSRRSSPIKTKDVQSATEGCRWRRRPYSSCVLPTLPLCFGHNHLKHVRFHQMLR